MIQTNERSTLFEERCNDPARSSRSYWSPWGAFPTNASKSSCRLFARGHRCSFVTSITVHVRVVWWCESHKIPRCDEHTKHFHFTVDLQRSRELGSCLKVVLGLVVEPGRPQGWPGSCFLGTSFSPVPFKRPSLDKLGMTTMAQQAHEIRVRIDQIERLLMFDYEPGTEGALFDICDASGHIVKSGDVRGPVTRVRIMDLNGEDYYLMVLDGETSTVKPFQLRRAS
jgi:hypothetical protein